MKLPYRFSDILLPRAGVDLSKWAIVAVDQFTSDAKYWQDLDAFVGDSPSTLRLTIPEIYLSKDNSSRISAVNDTMNSYLRQGLFETVDNCAVLVERSTPFNPRRLGLVVGIDLECYSFVPADKALIRATEGTILERIPPRIEIRKNAPLEIPHIILLIDDPDRTVIEPLFDSANEVLYDFELNMGAGHVRGYKLTDRASLDSALAGLLDPERLQRLYGGDSLLFAVGDGNHSLATAKSCWDTIKASLSDSERANHPARFALAEIENIYDEGITFEPIHRAIFGVDAREFYNQLAREFSECSGESYVIFDGKKMPIRIPSNSIEAVDRVQKFADSWLKNHSGASIDYIHGSEELQRIGGLKDAVCVALPAMQKNALFPYVVKHGSLPRKTFSMGEGLEKRYYIEARSIK